MTIKMTTILSSIIMTTSFSMFASAQTEKCFETNDGIEICIKQKVQTSNSTFTQENANQLAESLPKLSDKQLAAVKILLQSQQGKTVSSQDVQKLISSIPALPDAYLNALSLYLNSSESNTANPKEIEKVLTEIFNIEPQYQASLQSVLKMLSEKQPTESDIVGLFTQLLKANDVPDEIGSTLNSYVKMTNNDGDQQAEDQFLKSGIGLLKLIIQESKKESTRSDESDAMQSN